MVVGGGCELVLEVVSPKDGASIKEADGGSRSVAR